MKRFARSLAWIALCIVVIFHLLGLYFGVANVITAVIIYFLLFFVPDRLFASIGKLSWKRSGARLTWWTVFALMLIFEVTLRYVTKNNLSYGERIGQFNYSCPYSQDRFENFTRLRILKEDDAGIRLALHDKVLYTDNAEFNYAHSFNRLGMREIQPDDDQLDTSFVILGLGDSFTEGIGAPQDSTWVNLLADLLRPAIPNVVGVNAGNSGSDLVFETYKLKQLLYDIYQPDVVILAINNSDINDVLFRGGSERFVKGNKIRYRSGPWWKYFYASSHIFRLFAAEVFGIGPDYYTEEGFAQMRTEAVELINTELDNLVSYASEKEIDLIVVFTPVQNDLENGSFDLEPCYKTMHLQPAQNVHVVNLHDRFREKIPSDQFQSYFWPIDGHNNSKGYKFWAEQIAAELIIPENGEH